MLTRRNPNAILYLLLLFILVMCFLFWRSSNPATTYINQLPRAENSIVFICDFGLRGVQVSTFDYADFAEKILGMKVFVIIVDRYADSPESIVTKWTHRFGNRLFWTRNERDKHEALMVAGQASFIYCQIDSLHNEEDFYIDDVNTLDLGASIPLLHAVFDADMKSQRPLARCARISTAVKGDDIPVVSLLVRPPPLTTGADLRTELSIPQDAPVFGSYGGKDSFNIEFAIEVIKDIASYRKDIYFLFMNINAFLHTNMPNIICVPGTADIEYKGRFVQACDAMIHARSMGETFGLACAEFSTANRPVITCASMGDQEHSRILGTKGLFYTDANSLASLILGFDRNAALARKWNAYDDFLPENVMNTFNKVFVQAI